MSDSDSGESGIKTVFTAIRKQRLDILAATEKYRELLKPETTIITTATEDGGCNGKLTNGRISSNSEEKDTLPSHDGEDECNNIGAFDENNENELVIRILELGDHFNGIREQHIEQIIFEYAEINHIKHQFDRERRRTDSKWCSKFIDRHPELKTCLNRGEAVSSNSPNDDEILNKFMFDYLNRKAIDSKTNPDVQQQFKSEKQELKETLDQCDEASSVQISNNSDKEETEATVSNLKPTEPVVALVEKGVISDQELETKGHIETCGETNAIKRDKGDGEDEFHDADVTVPEKSNVSPDTECDCFSQGLKLVDYDSDDEFGRTNAPEQNTNKFSESTEETKLECKSEEHSFDDKKTATPLVESDSKKNSLEEEYNSRIDEPSNEENSQITSDSIEENNAKLVKDITSDPTENKVVEIDNENDENPLEETHSTNDEHGITSDDGVGPVIQESDSEPKRTESKIEGESTANTSALTAVEDEDEPDRESQSVESSVEKVETETNESENDEHPTGENEMEPPLAKEFDSDVDPVVRESDSEPTKVENEVESSANVSTITCTDDEDQASCKRPIMENSMKDVEAETKDSENESHPSNSAYENEISPLSAKECDDVDPVVDETNLETKIHQVGNPATNATEDEDTSHCDNQSTERAAPDFVSESTQETHPSDSTTENEIAPPPAKESDDDVNLVVQESDHPDSDQVENIANPSETTSAEHEDKYHRENQIVDVEDENPPQESTSSKADNDKNSMESSVNLESSSDKNADSSNLPKGSEIDKIEAPGKATNDLPSESGIKDDLESAKQTGSIPLNSKILDPLTTNAEASAPPSDNIPTPKNSGKRKNRSESENSTPYKKPKSKSKRGQDKTVDKPRKKKYLYKLKSFTGSVLYFTSPISVTFIKPVITLTRIDEKDCINPTPNTSSEDADPPQVDDELDSSQSTLNTTDTSQQSAVETETPSSRRMQTRKKQMKFLPDGTLVRPGQSADEYSPPSPKRRKRPIRNESKVSENLELVEKSEESTTEVKKTKPLKIKDPYIQTSKSISMNKKPQKIFDYDSYYREKGDAKGMIVIPPSAKTQKVAVSRMKSLSHSANIGKLKVNPAELLSCLLGVPITQDQIRSVRFKPPVKSRKADNQINITSNNEAMKPIIKQQIQLLQNTSIISNTDHGDEKSHFPDPISIGDEEFKQT